MSIVLSIERYFENVPHSGHHQPRFGTAEERQKAQTHMRQYLESKGNSSEAVSRALLHWKMTDMPIPAYILDFIDPQSDAHEVTHRRSPQASAISWLLNPSIRRFESSHLGRRLLILPTRHGSKIFRHFHFRDSRIWRLQSIQAFARFNALLFAMRCGLSKL
jgi:hypothetical protein